MTMEAFVLKMPPSIRIIKHNPNRTNRTLRTAPFASASASAPAPLYADSQLGPGSLGHLTRPDFPILHQAILLFYFVNSLSAYIYISMYLPPPLSLSSRYGVGFGVVEEEGNYLRKIDSCAGVKW